MIRSDPPSPLFSGNCWPTPSQQLLLDAALLASPPLWERYLATHDLQTIEPASIHLLPLVYRALHPSHPSCASVYRHTWTHNQLLFATLRSTLPHLHPIPVCLLKGAALIPAYYRDPGVRVLGDLDLLVPREEALRAIEILVSKGWTICDRVAGGDLRRFIARGHALLLSNTFESRSVYIDLHWSLFEHAGLDARFASYAPQLIPFSSPLTGPCHLLSPADSLLHLLSHGLRYSPTPLIRWIPDATILLRHSPLLDGDTFTLQAQKLGLSLLFSSALSYLSQRSYAPIPSALLKAPSASWQERSYARFISRQWHPLFHIFQVYWHAHLRNAPAQASRWRLLFSFPAFVKRVKGFSRSWQLFPFILKGIYARIRNF